LVRGIERSDLVALGERGVVEDGVERALPSVRGGRGLVLSLRPHAPLVCSPVWKMIGLPMAHRALGRMAGSRTN